MFRNYLKIALRNLARNKASSFINIGGLSVGMAVAMLIGLWIHDELSFNTYHKNYSRIAKVLDHQSWPGGNGTNDALPIPLGTVLRSSFGSDFKYVVMVREDEEHIISSSDKKFTQTGNYMEADAPEMLSLEMVHGTRQGFREPNSILLSQSLAKKLFGDEDPMNKVAKIDTKTDVKVRGVYKDLPVNTEFRNASFIASFDLLERNKTDWTNYNILIYAQLNANADLSKASAKIREVLQKNVSEKESSHALFLHPMSKWHLFSAFENAAPVRSEKMKFVWSYGWIGFVVLLLACINFMNLSTARSEKRAGEVGIRKAIGSLRSQLVQQFYIESLLTVSFAFVCSLCIVQLILPWFNSVADKSIQILWTNLWFWLASIGFTFITGLLAGSYPAVYLSSFKPIKVLKGSLHAGRFATLPRKVMVVIQFTASIALVIGTIIVYRQIYFAKNRPVGYSQEGLITIQMKSPDLETKYDVLRRELHNTGMIDEMARSSYAVTDTRGWNPGFEWEGKAADFNPSFNTIYVSHEYGTTVGWELKEGRDFSRSFGTDPSGIILNEAAVKLMGLKDPVGKMIRWSPGWRESSYFKVVGVVKDMIKGSPFSPTHPSIIFLGGGSWAFIKINPNVNPGKALAKIESVFSNLIPSVPFDYKFVDEEYGLKFAAEERISKLATFFAVLAILISCLGLFGLASFVAERRTKEIGVRKVLGATTYNLWSMLSREFIKLVIVSCFIAIPVAWYFLHQWLQKYEYRTDLSWWIFAAAGAGALLITLLTISYHAIRTALANPVKSLRTE